MASTDLVAQPFSRPYDETHALYDNGDFEGCVIKAQELLEDPNLPRYYRIKTLVLLRMAIDE
jgi:hypothetical protein